MTPHELDAEQLLGALGDLQRAQRAELERLDEPARELAMREPERMPAFEARLLRELGVAAPKTKSRRVGQVVSLVAASCALAASALLWLRAPATFDIQYTVVAPNADALERGAPLTAAEGPYTLGRSLTFLLRPAVRYSGVLHVFAHAAKDGALVELRPRVELDPAGGARVTVMTGPGSELTSDGSWQLHFYVSPAALSQAELRAPSCPASTRCLTVSARLVKPQGL